MTERNIAQVNGRMMKLSRFTFRSCLLAAHSECPSRIQWGPYESPYLSICECNCHCYSGGPGETGCCPHCDPDEAFRPQWDTSLNISTGPGDL